MKKGEITMEPISDRPFCPIDTTVAPKGAGFLQGGAVSSAFISAFL
jgi:hypothetical protein